MARWGRVDYRQLQRLAKKMEKLERGEFDKFCEAAAKELAARLLAKVIKRTPVGNYEDGHVGGTLRRGWTVNTAAEAESGGRSNVKKYAESLNIVMHGDVYQIEIINPVDYASYVEFGHRTANHKGWVKGQFMMTISADEVDAQAPQIVEMKLMKFLGEVFDAD
ncbi:HK97 gp10 family phage protein [Viridibacillus arvi]|uniref:HK97 gp10 family phage protein n=1 Tax=Viridibacillus arvi TaxID=263475 RepID=UPI003D26F619